MLLMFHGTSDAHLESLLQNGLKIPENPEDRLSTHFSAESDPHLASLDGIYVAAAMAKTESFSRQACQIHGGSPAVLTLVADPLDTVPDEDNVLEFLSNYGEDLPSFFEMDGFLDRWRRESGFRAAVSARMAKDIMIQFSPASATDVEMAVSDMLDFAFEAMDEESMKDMVERNSHWLSPVLLQNAIYADGGMDRYRGLMDRLTKSMRGTQPFDDFESHTLRVPAAVGFAGRTRIIGIGTYDEPFLHHAGEIDSRIERLLREAMEESPATSAPAA